MLNVKVSDREFAGLTKGQRVNRAYSAVSRAIRHGLLTRPSICENCAAIDRKIYAAHFDYRYRLKIKWLCQSCNIRWDIAVPKNSGYGIPGGQRKAVTKSEFLTVPASSTEKLELRRKALAEGFTLATYIRRLIDTHPDRKARK